MGDGGTLRGEKGESPIFTEWGWGREDQKCLERSLLSSLRDEKFIDGVYTSYDFVIRMIYTYELHEGKKDDPGGDRASIRS
jgi:hypothetical protein